MQIYSAYARPRILQILSDLFAVATVIVFIMLGAATAALVKTLAELGRGIESAGRGFQGTMIDAADTIAGIPFIGEGASAPFTDASEAGATLVEAGRAQQELVENAAFILGLLVAVVPIAVLVRFWLMKRIAFVRRAATARRLAGSSGGTQLLALRALSFQKPSMLLAVSADPVAGWLDGDRVIVRRLADMELRGAGVKAQ